MWPTRCCQVSGAASWVATMTPALAMSRIRQSREVPHQTGTSTRIASQWW